MTMNKVISMTTLLGVIVLLLSLCACNENLGSSQVKIGEQIWMAKNLNVSSFKNGDPIPEAKTFEDWKKAMKEKKPAYCYPEFKSEKSETLGKLYNFYAVTDARGLAPESWRIPNDEDWDLLKSSVTAAHGAEGVGTQLKVKKEWDDIPGGMGTPASNRTGFSAFPCAYIHVVQPNEFGNLIGTDGFSSEFKNYASANWWVSDGSSTVSLIHNTDRLGGGGTPPGEGHSVRCVKI